MLGGTLWAKNIGATAFFSVILPRNSKLYYDGFILSPIQLSFQIIKNLFLEKQCYCVNIRDITHSALYEKGRNTCKKIDIYKLIATTIVTMYQNLLGYTTHA